MRASALGKKYGWGVHYDAHGKMALYGLDSREYEQFTEPRTDGLKLLLAMRSRRG